MHRPRRLRRRPAMSHRGDQWDWFRSQHERQTPESTAEFAAEFAARHGGGGGRGPRGFGGGFPPPPPGGPPGSPPFAGFPWNFLFRRGGTRARRGDVRAGILALL